MPDPIGEHLSEAALAAFMDRSLNRDQRARVTDHLEACPRCREDLRAAVSAGSAYRRRHVRPALVATVAAASVAAILLMSPAGSAPGVDPPVLRSDEAVGVSTFPAVSPPSGARIAGDRVELVWRSVEPDALYELTLTDARGDAVWATAVRDTSVVVPASVGLGSGSPHYWYVDALLERGRSARTDVMEFTVVR